MGQVWASSDGGAETLFTEGPGGTVAADWILDAHKYVFKLYEGTAHSNVLESVTITAENSVLIGSGVLADLQAWVMEHKLLAGGIAAGAVLVMSGALGGGGDYRRRRGGLF